MSTASELTATEPHTLNLLMVMLFPAVGGRTARKMDGRERMLSNPAFTTVAKTLTRPWSGHDSDGEVCPTKETAVRRKMRPASFRCCMF